MPKNSKDFSFFSVFKTDALWRKIFHSNHESQICFLDKSFDKDQNFFPLNFNTWNSNSAKKSSLHWYSAIQRVCPLEMTGHSQTHDPIVFLCKVWSVIRSDYRKIFRWKFSPASTHAGRVHSGPKSSGGVVDVDSVDCSCCAYNTANVIVVIRSATIMSPKAANTDLSSTFFFTTRVSWSNVTLSVFIFFVIVSPLGQL